MSFSVWLILLSIMPSRPIHVVMNGKISSFYGWLVFQCMYICVCICVCLCVCIHFLYLFIHNWYLNCFRVLATVNNVAVNMGYMYLFKLVFSFPLEKFSEVELLNYMVVIILIFWEISILFSIVTIPIYILTNSAWGFPFLYVLANICVFFLIFKNI